METNKRMPAVCWILSGIFLILMIFVLRIDGSVTEASEVPDMMPASVREPAPEAPVPETLAEEIPAGTVMITGGTELIDYEVLLRDYIPEDTDMPTQTGQQDSEAEEDLPYTDEELELLANVMYHENYWTGRNWEERCEAMLLTGSVVLNRVNCPWYPDTVREVLYQKGQYATTGKFYTEPVPEEIYALAVQLLTEGSIAPENVLFQSMYENLGSGTYRTICGEYFNYE